jgi:predicted DNA-binding ribbon-helix-helix protein
VFKRSVFLHGHKTSFSLEDEFWNGLREIAEREKKSLRELVEQIDHEHTNNNLSSAIRVFVFNYFRTAARCFWLFGGSEIRVPTAQTSG